MGVRALARIAERLQAEGRPSERARRGRRARHAARPADACWRRSPTSPSAPRPRASARRRSRSSGPSPRCARISRGSSAGRCTAAPSPSRARGPRRARSPRGCASSAPTWSRRPPSARARSPRTSRDLAGYDLLVATSPNGVHELFARLRDTGRDARGLAGLRVAAIGPGTARALAEHGVTADSSRSAPWPRGSSRRWPSVPVERALIARGSERPRRAARRPARARRARDVLALYETVPEPLDADARRGDRGADYVTFTSASTVRHLLAAAGARPSSGRGSPRSGRPRAPSCAPMAASPTSRPTRTPPTAWWTRCWPTREAEAHGAARSPSSPTTGSRTSSSASCTP